MSSLQSPKSPSGTAKTATPTSPKSPSQAGSPQNPNPNPAVDEPIAADENVDETLDLDDNASSSASITSSIMRYRHENGRTYHAYKDGAYVYPNDDREIERLDIQHHMSYLTQDGKLFLCPADPKKMHRVLDAGTGSGVWAMDFADEHPNVEVIGVDLSPIQSALTPPNLQFFVDDLEDTWTYDYQFDLIYSRMLTGSISDWPKYFKQAYDNLAPGGWFELKDGVVPYASDDGTLQEDSALFRWTAYAHEASHRLGRPLDAPNHHAELMRQTGFINVTEQKFKWPTNNWPLDPKYKELGMWMYENCGKNLGTFTLAPFTRGLGWSRTEVEVFLIGVRRDFKDTSIHAYAPINVVYGQKPYDA